MNYRKSNRLLIFRSFLYSLIFIGLTFILYETSLFAGSYVEVGETLTKMLRDSDEFCVYLEDNEEKFNNTFENCVNENIQRRNNQIAEILRHCEELYTDADQRNACFEEDYNGLDLENQISYLQNMLSMTHDGADCMIAYQLYGWAEDEWDPNIFGKTWDEFWDDQLPAMRSGYACTTPEPDNGDDKKWYECFISSTLDNPSRKIYLKILKSAQNLFNKIFHLENDK